MKNLPLIAIARSLSANIVTIFLAALSGFLLYMAGCKKQEDTPNTETFEQLAKDFLATPSTGKRLPLSFKQSRIVGRITRDDIHAQARKLVEEMVFVDTAQGLLTIAKFHLSVVPPTIIDAWTADFLNTDSLIREGYYLVQLDWEAANGQAFSTLGTMQSDGTPMFEPILHFNSREESIQPRTNDRGKQEESWRCWIKNGLGCTCVEVEWKVKIQTSLDNCRIVDPAPHVQITKQVSNCWGWEQITIKGQLNWCNEIEECVCSDGRFGEDCIKWAVVT